MKKKILHLEIWLTAIYFVVVLIGILHHEPWRDEFQAWMIAKASKTPIDILANARLEGHPMLWFLLLYVVKLFSTHIFAMQLLHITLSTIAVYIFLRYSPFSLIEKFLFISGYYLLFEYALISRSYILSMVLAFSFCALYSNAKKNIIYLAFILLLLANTSVFGLGLCCSFLLFLIVDLYFNKPQLLVDKAFRVPLVLSVIIIGIGILLSVLQVKPKPEFSMPIAWPKEIQMDRLKIASLGIPTAYFPIPKESKEKFWNTGIFIKEPVLKDPNLHSYFLLAMGIIVFFSLLFSKNIAVSLLYAGGSLCLYGLLYVTLLFREYRFIGAFYTLFISSFWLYMSAPETKSPLLGFAKKIKPIGHFFFIFILSIHTIAGLSVYSKNMRYTFSNIPDAGEFIASHELKDAFVFGTIDYVVSPLADYLDKPIYYPERKGSSSFMLWDTAKKWNLNFNDMLADMIGKAQEHKEMMAILSYPLINSQTREIIQEGNLTTDIMLKLIGRFDKNCISKDEKYYIYHIFKQTEK